MSFELTCEGSFAISDPTEADLQRVFDDDHLRGDFLILTAPNGDYMQAAGDETTGWVLEHRTASTSEHLVAQGALTKEQVRAALIDYLQAETTWKSNFQWSPLEQNGCLGMVLAWLVALPVAWSWLNG